MYTYTSVCVNKKVYIYVCVVEKYREDHLTSIARLAKLPKPPSQVRSAGFQMALDHYADDLEAIPLTAEYTFQEPKYHNGLLFRCLCGSLRWGITPEVWSPLRFAILKSSRRSSGLELSRLAQQMRASRMGIAGVTAGSKRETWGSEKPNTHTHIF